jgi:NAD(P)-dependent dehydrogenase (short-subunit alcohol dehydrogenase family)
MKKLEGKTIVVTGGGTGIGLAVSKKLASDGANIIICSRNEKNLNIALKEIREINPDSENYYFVTDVSKFEDVQVFANWCKYKFIHIHGLVNCAGIYGPIGKTTSVNMKEFLDTININLMGTIYMCSELAPLFSSDSKKKIVNFSGGGAASSFPNYSAYATSKVAIVRFTENLALELQNENFDINCIAPGFVITRLHQQTIESGSDNVGELFYENTKKQIENGGVPPEKAADLTSFLLSDESNGITGKFISAPWDNWEAESFQELLKTDKDFATIRRIDNKTYFKK